MSILYGYNFEKIVKEILIACGYNDISIEANSLDKGYDILMKKIENGKEQFYAFETKAISSSFDKFCSTYLKQI